jgi:BclB C-terminal domain-containing protein
VHVIGGLGDTGAVVGDGASLDSVAVGGATIDLTGAVGVVTNMAFSMPRAGTLDALAAFFSTVGVVQAFPLGGEVIVQLYRSTTPDNIFTAVPGALVTLPFPAGLIAAGTFANGITTGINVPVAAQDRLLLVVRVTVAGVDVATTIVGYLSAGLTIV